MDDRSHVAPDLTSPRHLGDLTDPVAGAGRERRPQARHQTGRPGRHLGLTNNRLGLAAYNRTSRRRRKLVLRAWCGAVLGLEAPDLYLGKALVDRLDVLARLRRAAWEPSPVGGRTLPCWSLKQTAPCGGTYGANEDLHRVLPSDPCLSPFRRTSNIHPPLISARY